MDTASCRVILPVSWSKAMIFLASSLGKSLFENGIIQDSLVVIQGIFFPPTDSSISLVQSMSCLLGVRRQVTGSGDDANGSHCSTSMPKLLDNPAKGVLANSSSKASSAGRTMARG